MDAVELLDQLEFLEEMARNNSITLNVCSCDQINISSWTMQTPDLFRGM